MLKSPFAPHTSFSINRLKILKGAQCASNFHRSTRPNFMAMLRNYAMRLSAVSIASDRVKFNWLIMASVHNKESFFNGFVMKFLVGRNFGRVWKCFTPRWRMAFILLRKSKKFLPCQETVTSWGRTNATWSQLIPFRIDPRCREPPRADIDPRQQNPYSGLQGD